MSEQFTNDFETALAEDITAGAKSLKVISAVGAPLPDFRIRVGDEIMLVTAVGGTGSKEWTVSRAVEAVRGVTAAAAHSAGSKVDHLVTAAGLAGFEPVGEAAAVVSALVAAVDPLGDRAAAAAEVKAEKERGEGAEAALAPIASPTFTGTPKAPSPAEGDNSTKLATTFFVQRPKQISRKQLTTLARATGGAPAGSIASNMKLLQVNAATVALAGSGTMRLVSGLILPGGEPVKKIGIVLGSTEMVGPEHFWLALVGMDFSRLGLTEDSTGVVAKNQLKYFSLAAEFTPENDLEVQVGILFKGTTSPTLAGVVPPAGVQEIKPFMAASSSTGLTTPASCPEKVTEPTTGTGNVPFICVA